MNIKISKCYIGAYIKTEAYLDKKLQVVMSSKAGMKPLHALSEISSFSSDVLKVF